eukprot:321555_1
MATSVVQNEDDTINHVDKPEIIIHDNKPIPSALNIVTDTECNQNEIITESNEFDEKNLMDVSSMSCFQKMDYYDKYYSSVISEAKCTYIIELMLYIITFMYSIVGVLILAILYSIIYKSFLYIINVIVGAAINVCTKRIIKRNRPSVIKANILSKLIFINGTYSMPSGDTNQSSLFAVTMIYTMNDYKYYHTNNRYLWCLLLLMIPLTAFDRVYFKKHYISDTIIGGIEGLFIGVIICYGFGHFLFL